MSTSIMPTNIGVTHDQDVIISEIDIAAPPELIFKAICDAETVRRRCPQLDVFEMDLRVGGHWRLEIRVAKPRRGCSVTRHDGEILELDAPRLLVYTWFANFHEDPSSRSVVRWELTPTESGTHVKVTHSGLASEPAARADYAGGWPGVLEEIKIYAEKQPAGGADASSASPEKTMPKAIVTPDQDAVVSEIEIAAPAERVFQALTRSDELSRWFSSPDCPVQFWKMDARLGGHYQYATEKGTVVVNNVREFECRGEILEIDPPRLLVYTWIANWHLDKARSTVVRWELTPTKTGTHVKVTHSGLAQEEAARKDYSGGWPGVLEMLKKFAEK